MIQLRRAGLFALVAVGTLSCTADAALPLVERNDALPEAAELWEDTSKQRAKSDYLRRLSEGGFPDELALEARRLSDKSQAEATETSVARELVESEPNHRTPVRRTPEGKRTRDHTVVCRCAPGDPLCGP